MAEVKSTDSSREATFKSHHPHGSSRLSVTSVLRGGTNYSFLRHQAHMCTDIHTAEHHTHKAKNLLKKFKFGKPLRKDLVSSLLWI